MSGRPSRFDILFEPVRIGPLTTRNRFYQVPHCNGMGRAYPSALATMRGIKAEGGWGVVCTEQCDIHHSANHLRSIRLWDEKDVATLAPVAENIHQHGALAGIELAHNGYHVANPESRTPPLAPSATPVRALFPGHAREMDLDDIRALRRWQRAAARNARSAGFDIIYIYAGHDMTLPAHFLSRRHNRRTDAYGGPLENRARLLRELIADTRDVVGDRCAVAVRFSVDEITGTGGLAADAEGRDVLAHLAELPDLWDITTGPFETDGQTARFADEGFQEQSVAFVRTLTSRPVVGVGRFTSPDLMVSMIRRGVLDLIGAARPSIADPFLPTKIAEGRFDDIRECIGCNVCVATDKFNVPIRCTQNPTMGEEWRRGWHPERIPARSCDDRILVVGSGPAGLEAARALGQRGHEVILAESEREAGGRVLREAALPGLASWRRVTDWRLTQLRRMPEVTLALDSPVDTTLALEVGAARVVIATGSRWRRDGLGRTIAAPLAAASDLQVLTPDDIMAGLRPHGRVVLFDDDHYYMGSVLAECCAQAGAQVIFVTPESLPATFTQYTGEQKRIHRRLLDHCAHVHLLTRLVGLAPYGVELACVVSGQRRFEPADAVLLVTAQSPIDTLFTDLMAVPESERKHAGIQHIHRIGDCLAPGPIAAAVHAGHLYARTLADPTTDVTPYRREAIALDPFQPLPTF